VSPPLDRAHSNEVPVVALKRKPAEVRSGQMPLLQHRAHRPIEHEDAVTEERFERAALFVQLSYSVTTFSQLGRNTCDRGDRHQTMPCPDEPRLPRNIPIARVTDADAEGAAFMGPPRASPLFHSDLGRPTE
jgi:hypothetical protein